MFCGWLCPFGALQELTNDAARWLRVPQLTIPPALQSRLIALKYLLFLGLVVASFFSWELAMTGTEVEPFKAAIILRFMTEWPMVAYALVIVAAGVFIERFYCRFACPLGGGLAILGRVRMFDWLHRRPECGSRCHHCETVCPVGAIKPSGDHQHERMLLLPGLPGRLLRRSRLPAAGLAPQAPRVGNSARAVRWSTRCRAEPRNEARAPRRTNDA